LPWKASHVRVATQFARVKLNADELEAMAPAAFSYHVASLFGGSASYQQLILQVSRRAALIGATATFFSPYPLFTLCACTRR